MTLTSQITKFTCPLACIESFAQDTQLPYTQASLLHDYPDLCSVGAKLGDEDASGALTIIQFAALCQHLGLQPLLFRDFRPEVTIPILLNLKARETVVFFIVRFGGAAGSTHYVRYSHMPAPGVFEVMNPRFQAPLFHPITWEQFVTWDTYCVRLTAPEPQPNAPQNA